MAFRNRGPRPLFGYNGGPPRGPMGPPRWRGPGGPRMGWGMPPHHPYYDEPPFGEPGFGEPPFGQPRGPMGPPEGGFDTRGPPGHFLDPEGVKDWLARQHPSVIQDICFHSKWLLDKMGCPIDLANAPPPGPAFQRAADDGSGDPNNPFCDDDPEGPSEAWYTPFNSIAEMNQRMPGPPNAKKAKGRPHPGLGYSKLSGKKGQIQWTPEGWVQKDNTHKITSAMRPLPELPMIPPLSTTYPDSSADRDKLKILKNNVDMMTTELNKICKRFKIQMSALNREDVTMYPENQQDKLKVAITCVVNAEKTLDDFKNFLKTEKYKEWNDRQNQVQEEQVKEMIGDTPEGTPFKKPVDDDEDEKVEWLQATGAATEEEAV